MKRMVSWIRGLYHYKDLVGQLVSRDIKIKYRRSVLGYVWSVLNPLMIMMVMVIVFSTMFKRSIENFPVYLLTGQIMFNFMNQSTHQAMNSIVGNASLLKKTYVPKYIFTLSKITSGLVDFVFSLGALIIVMLVTKTAFSCYMILFPFVAVQLYVFCVGLGLILAEATVFFRDIQYIYSVITTAWLYLTPMFYPITALPEQLQYAVSHFNPMYYYIEQFRALILHNRLPEVRLVIGGFVFAIVILVIGIWRFLKKQDDFILYI
jgi:lipopolysaccharide transport system permease protein